MQRPLRSVEGAAILQQEHETERKERKSFAHLLICFSSKHGFLLNTCQWCLDCTEWQIKTENGETLPAPGAQLSAEEMMPRLPHPEHLRDEMVFEHHGRELSGSEVCGSHVTGGDEGIRLLT